jgi:hypothetical protein
MENFLPLARRLALSLRRLLRKTLRPFFQPSIDLTCGDRRTGLDPSFDFPLKFSAPFQKTNGFVK